MHPNLAALCSKLRWEHGKCSINESYICKEEDIVFTQNSLLWNNESWSPLG